MRRAYHLTPAAALRGIDYVPPPIAPDVTDAPYVVCHGGTQSEPMPRKDAQDLLRTLPEGASIRPA